MLCSVQRGGEGERPCSGKAGGVPYDTPHLLLVPEVRLSYLVRHQSLMYMQSQGGWIVRHSEPSRLHNPTSTQHCVCCWWRGRQVSVAQAVMLKGKGKLLTTTSPVSPTAVRSPWLTRHTCFWCRRYDCHIWCVTSH